jgi:hypothetical protein
MMIENHLQTNPPCSGAGTNLPAPAGGGAPSTCEPAYRNLSNLMPNNGAYHREHNATNYLEDL